VQGHNVNCKTIVSKFQNIYQSLSANRYTSHKRILQYMSISCETPNHILCSTFIVWGLCQLISNLPCLFKNSASFQVLIIDSLEYEICNVWQIFKKINTKVMPLVLNYIHYSVLNFQGFPHFNWLISVCFTDCKRKYL